MLTLFVSTAAIANVVKLEQPSVTSSTQKISLNHATQKQLQQLKGIGKKKALAIIAYRDLHGQFTSLEQLKQVKGLGKKVIQENASYLSL